jgi:hypothetical protein
MLGKGQNPTKKDGRGQTDSIKVKFKTTGPKGKNRKHSGSNRYRHGLPQKNPRSSATKRKDGQMGLQKTKNLLHNKRNGI